MGAFKNIVLQLSSTAAVVDYLLLQLGAAPGSLTTSQPLVSGVVEDTGYSYWTGASSEARSELLDRTYHLVLPSKAQWPDLLEDLSAHQVARRPRQAVRALMATLLRNS